jgi:CRISPR-associated endoribonuclease Cas6
VEIGLEMYAEKPLILPFFTGYISRGLLLHILRMVNPKLASSMHEADKPKPYSVTPLKFKATEKNEKGYLIDPVFPCHVNFRFLSDEVAKHVLEYFYKNADVLIYDAVFKVASLSVKSESYEDLCKMISEPVKNLCLHFKTPTYLASLGTDFHFMFPDHMRIFPNLMRLWNLFSDFTRFSKEEFLEYKEWLIKNVGVCKHRLMTKMVFMRRKKANGFIGWVDYELKALDKWNKITQILAKFAEYSNIGGNRTGGFGVTKQKNTREIKNES